MRKNTGTAGPVVEVSTRSRWASAANVSTVGLFIISVIAVLYLTRGIIVPVVLAIIIGTILAPIVARAERHRIPRVVSTILIVVMLLVALVFFAVALTAPLADWIGRASELGNLLRSRLQDFRQPLTALQDLYGALQNIGGGASEGPEAIKIEASANASIIETALSVLTPALSQLLIFFVSLIFYVIFKNDFKASAILAFSTRETRLKILRIYNDVEGRLARFFTTFTLINIAFGAIITLLMWIVDMPNPLLWGVLAGVLNFLPYLGPAIFTIALVVASLLTFPTLALAAVPPLIYTVVHVIEGEFVTPAVLGYSLAVNPFLLFLSVIFWTWMWGPIGAFLAVPIAMITAGVLENLFPGPEQPSLP